MRKRLLNVILIAASLLFTFLALEMAIRLASWIKTPTWAEKQQRFIDTLTVPFSYGLVRPGVFIPDLRVYFPSGQLILSPVPVRTNNHGLRMQDVQIEKQPGTIRIAALGDSSTFGWMVPEECGYPRILENLLNLPGERRYEVLNFGVPGYTSFHGRLQYNRSVSAFQPDLVLLAYGFNDAYEFRFSEEEFFERLLQDGLIDGLKGFSLFLYDRSILVRWVFKRIQSKKRTGIEEDLRRRTAQNLWQSRVDRESYKDHLRGIIQDVHSQGGRTILLNLDLPNTWVKKPLQSLAAEMDLELADIQERFLQLSRSDTQASSIEQRLAASGVIQTDPSAKRLLTFRVWIPEEVDTSRGIFLLLNSSTHSWPLEQPMFDDGTHGDERAGDRVWTVAVEIEESECLDYEFLNERIPRDPDLYENSPKALRYYHFIDLESLTEDASWISPVHPFNRIPFESLLVPGDCIHPNEEGHRRIAEILVPLIHKVME